MTGWLNVEVDRILLSFHGEYHPVPPLVRHVSCIMHRPVPTISRWHLVHMYLDLLGLVTPYALPRTIRHRRAPVLKFCDYGRRRTFEPLKR